MSKYRIKTTVLPDGERLSTLLGRDGLPLFLPTIYSVSELRGRNLAYATINISLRALIVLELVLEGFEDSVNLEARLESGNLFSLAELELLCSACRWPVSQVEAQVKAQSATYRVKGSLPERFEKRRILSSGDMVASQTVANRLQVIRDYLAWLIRLKQSERNTSVELREDLEVTSRIIQEAITARIPGHKYVGIQREGLDEESVEALLAAIAPESEINPWSHPHVRARNALIVHWFLYLGLRRGELLNVQVMDIDFSNEQVSIVRRPDHGSDPRRYQPHVKTRARVVPLSPGLLEQTRDYILQYRSEISAANKHPYLFVSKTGQPLSIPACSRIFDVLRRNRPELPRNLSPHVLRHTWNDRYSRQMDELGVDEDTEKKTRTYLMGWSPSSEMPSVYTKRHIREKAKRVSLALQEKLAGHLG